jgi:Ca2+-transporting ATPase
MGLPLPLLPLQILWLNMVTDTFPALALAMEPGDAGVMSRPPRDPQEAILARSFLLEILLYASLITVCAMGVFLWSIRQATDRAITVTFMTLALAQIFHLINARTRTSASEAWALWRNPYAIAAIGISAGLQLAAMYFAPLARLLRVVPLDSAEWAVVLIASVVPVLAGQVFSSFRGRGGRD